jgi:broad-specificity NMP kinase
LTEKWLDEVIDFLSQSWEDRIIQYDVLIHKLNLKCKADTLKKRLHARGYFR